MTRSFRSSPAAARSRTSRRPTSPGALRPTDHRTQHADLGETAWFEVVGGTRSAERGAWQHVALPEHAAILTGMVALAWRAMDAFYEEDDGIRGHAADPYHRIGIWL